MLALHESKPNHWCRIGKRLASFCLPEAADVSVNRCSSVKFNSTSEVQLSRSL